MTAIFCGSLVSERVAVVLLCRVWMGYRSHRHFDSRNLHLHCTIVPPAPPHNSDTHSRAHTHIRTHTMHIIHTCTTHTPKQATPPCTCPQPHVDTLAVKLLRFTWRHNWHKLLSRWYRSCCLRPSMPSSPPFSPRWKRNTEIKKLPRIWS